MPLSERDARTVKIGGIVAGVLLLGVLAMKVLGGGGGEPVTIPTGTAHPSSSASPGQSESPTLAPTPVALFQGRDPFSIPPVFIPPVTTTPPPSSPPPSSPPPSSPPPTQPDGSSIMIGGHQLVLLDIFTRNGVSMVQIEVDGTASAVARGDTFGPSNQYLFRSVSGNCATFTFGEQSFTLCISPQK